MNAPSPDDATPPPYAPYRVAHPMPGARPPDWRWSSRASDALCALALLVTLTSLHLTCALVGVIHTSALQSARERAPTPCAPAAVGETTGRRPVPVAVASDTAAASAPTRPPPTRGIRAVGRGVFVVSRRAIDEAIAGPGALMRRTVILPESRGGRVVGVRVFGIRRGDLLAALGFASGDVILRVNGVEVASPDRCLEAYARLRAADELTVTFERRGRARSQIYVIVAEA